MTRNIELRLPLRDHSDVAAARRSASEFAQRLMMVTPAVDQLATAVSEIAQNVLDHAGIGQCLVGTVRGAECIGVVVIIEDRGPGIADLERAEQDGFSTRGGLGLGLASARRLVDEFEIRSTLGQETVVTLTKWLRASRQGGY